MFGFLLFLIYINDIYNFLVKLLFYFFVDDMSLLYVDFNLKFFEKIVNSELFKVFDWFNVNKLMFNVKKLNYVIFCLY